MWKTVLENQEKYLKNPVLGSGFGFSARDLQIGQSEYFGGQGFIGGSEYEIQLINGGFHNGPLSTVRFVGIIGLILFYGLSVAMIIEACRLVIRTKKTPFFYLAVFLAVPTVYGLFSFTIIYGAFDGALQACLFTSAMLRCTSESLDRWRSIQRQPSYDAEQPFDKPPSSFPEKSH